nr:hypothetical protein [Tanacetum cinerariifolium]
WRTLLKKTALLHTKLTLSVSMDSLSPQVVSTAKLPILNPNEFDLWEMRIEQYFLMTYYSLWEVILNGHSPVPTRVVEDVKKLMEAIEKRFGRNTETKKVQKTFLKQQFENFTGSSSKSLDQIHNKLQKLVSQLEIHGVSLSQEDVNMNLKIYETEVKQSSSTSTALQNLAFMSSSHTDSTTNSVSAAASVSATFDKLPASLLPNVFQGFKKACVAEPQRRTIPVETSTSNALVSQCDGTRSYDWSYQAVKEPANFTLMAFSSSSSDNKIGLESVEARLLVYKQNESVFEENIKLLNINVQLRDTALNTLRQQLDKAEKDRDDLKPKLKKFQTSSKSLTELLASQTSEKTRLGYNSQDELCEFLLLE